MENRNSCYCGGGFGGGLETGNTKSADAQSAMRLTDQQTREPAIAQGFGICVCYRVGPAEELAGSYQ